MSNLLFAVSSIESTELSDTEEEAEVDDSHLVTCFFPSVRPSGNSGGNSKIGKIFRAKNLSVINTLVPSHSFK